MQTDSLISKISGSPFLLVTMSFILILLAPACGNDDNGIEVVPPRDVTEVSLENEDSIQKFLQTHFYNYEDFASAAPGENIDLVIAPIEGDNADKTPLADDILSTIVFRDDVDGNPVPHNLYYLIARQGIGTTDDDPEAKPVIIDSPSIADSTLITYRGTTLDLEIFDGSQIPIWFDLLATLQGFREAMPFFMGGTLIEMSNEPVPFQDFGVGLIIIPSGLAYFNSAPAGIIDSYESLIFNINLLRAIESDHDNDGVKSILEDVDNDRAFTDDTDSDFVFNFRDNDDDGDGTLTADEIHQNDPVLFDDTDGDGIPDYLDAN